MRAISLFSGAGGFEIGFQRAGIETVLQAESDPWCLSVLGRHWPDVERVTDVRSVRGGATPAGLDRHAGRRESDAGTYQQYAYGAPPTQGVDLVYGGFPCQDVSVAGKRSGFRGERSSLWFEFERVLREMRPRWTVIENVPGLLSSNDGRDFARVLMGLGVLGYGWAYRVLDARWFGVPQRRRRVLVVGCLGDARRAAQVLAVCESCGGYPAPRPEAGQGIARGVERGVDIVGSVRSHPRAGSNEVGTVTLAFGGNNTSGPIDLASGRSSRANRFDFDTDTFLVAGTLGAVHHGIESQQAWTNRLVARDVGVRRLTPLECERLMGWPDDWTRWTVDDREIPDSHRYRMCGNGVVATVAEWIGHRLVAVDGIPT